MGIAQRLLTHVGNGVNVSMESWTGGNRSSCNLDVHKYYIFVLCSITFII